MKGGGDLDIEKIGKFITEKRKECDLTQKQLAEKLHITDRAISKWENGKSLPDVAVMLDLCKVFNITVNDLLNGEVIVMENYKEKSEKLLIEMAKQKEESDRRLLKIEVWSGIILVLIFIVSMFGFSYIAEKIPEYATMCTIIVGILTALFVVACCVLCKIEQVAGYYQCQECKHTYVPSYKQVIMAPHMGRTRHMKCPKCGKKSWQKKVIKK